VEQCKFQSNADIIAGFTDQ